MGDPLNHQWRGRFRQVGSNPTWEFYLIVCEERKRPDSQWQIVAPEKKSRAPPGRRRPVGSRQRYLNNRCRSGLLGNSGPRWSTLGSRGRSCSTGVGLGRSCRPRGGEVRTKSAPRCCWLHLNEPHRRWVQWGLRSPLRSKKPLRLVRQRSQATFASLWSPLLSTITARAREQLNPERIISGSFPKSELYQRITATERRARWPLRCSSRAHCWRKWSERGRCTSPVGTGFRLCSPHNRGRRTERVVQSDRHRGVTGCRDPLIPQHAKLPLYGPQIRCQESP